MLKQASLWNVYILAYILQYARTDPKTAQTTLTCNGRGELNRPYEIACHVNGTITSGINWTRTPNVAVAACNVEHKCFPEPGYNVTVIGDTYTLHITSFQEHDAGNWECRDGGTGTMKEGCNLTIMSNASATGSISGGRLLVARKSDVLYFVVLIYFILCITR